MQDSVMTFSSVTCLSHRQYSVNSKLFAVYELILECMEYMEYKYQFGFRKNHSTSLALVDVLDTINNYLDKHEKVIAITGCAVAQALC